MGLKRKEILFKGILPFILKTVKLFQIKSQWFVF
jgi:hypothetical protein